MAQLESSANQPKEASVDTSGRLGDASQRLDVAQMELKAEANKLPSGMYVDSRGQLVRSDPTPDPTKTPEAAAKETSNLMRFYNWLTASPQAQTVVPNTAPEAVKKIAAPFIPINIAVSEAQKKKE